jgi:ketosteroid isomerase-like protein
VIVKHRGHAVVSFTGKPYDQMYVNEVHVLDGKITSFVEYYDTAVFNEAFTP